MAVKHYTGIDLVGSRAQHVADPAAPDDAANRRWTESLFDGFAPEPRVGSVASGQTVAIPVEAYDAFNITALAVDTLITATGTPEDHQKLMVRIKDNGTARQVSWDAMFADSGVAGLLSVTVPGKTHHVGLVYDAAAATWLCLACDPIGA